MSEQTEKLEKRLDDIRAHLATLGNAIAELRAADRPDRLRVVAAYLGDAAWDLRHLADDAERADAPVGLSPPPHNRCTCHGGLSGHKYGCPLYRPPVPRGA
jgi:hypothetical protein